MSLLGVRCLGTALVNLLATQYQSGAKAPHSKEVTRVPVTAAL